MIAYVGLTAIFMAASSLAGGASDRIPAQKTQVFFKSPAGMRVYWQTRGKDGKLVFSETPLETPGRFNFTQAAVYRLKLTKIPGRPGLELYPTMEVTPANPRTSEFLAHNSATLAFSDEDFKQVTDGNYLVKVIYLPNGQDGPEEISSGQDPVREATRRGAVLLVIRIGNIDASVPK